MEKSKNMNKILRDGESLTYKDFLVICKNFKQKQGESLVKLLGEIFTRVDTFDESFVESILNIFGEEQIDGARCVALVHEVNNLNKSLKFKRVLTGEEYFCLDESKSVFKTLQDFIILSKHHLGEVVDKNGNKASGEECNRLAVTLAERLAKKEARNASKRERMKAKKQAKKALANK